jgi:hypothetical protein
MLLVGEEGRRNLVTRWQRFSGHACVSTLGRAAV